MLRNEVLSILNLMHIASLFLDALLRVAAESAPYLFLGIAAAALLRAFIPEQQVYRLLGKSSFRSVFLALSLIHI